VWAVTRTPQPHLAPPALLLLLALRVLVLHHHLQLM
jgi:hypothetical protein